MSDRERGGENVERPRRAARRSESSGTSEGMCFVISPFGGWFDSYYQEIFRPAIVDADLEPRRADSLFRSSNIVHDIWHLVTTSRVVLADLTGKNPNVFYELGLAHAARKPVLLVTQTVDDVPFDLRALRVITYEVQDPMWGDSLRRNIKNGLRETLSSPEQAVLPTFLLEEPPRGPSVSREEKVMLELQQQLNVLRAQVDSLAPKRSAREGRSYHPSTVENVEQWLRQGYLEDDVVDRIVRLGVSREEAREVVTLAKAQLERDEAHRS